MNLELAIMKDCSRWPLYPVLPVKRGFGKDRQLGVILAIDELKQDAKDAGWALPEGTFDNLRFAVFFDASLSKLGETIKTILDGKHPKSQKYESYEAIADDGWIVD